MKCPHCGHVGRHPARETRKDDDAVYRRRQCENCLRGFVTKESAAPGQKMPGVLVNSYSRRGVPRPGADQPSSPAFDTAHLQRLLSGR
jgi:transcriptional regulator NrdR family protein